MIRRLVMFVLSGLLCLVLAGCSVLEIGRQQEPAATQVEAVESTAPIVKETDAHTLATTTPKLILPETEVVPSTATTEPESAETAVLEPETASAGSAVFAQKVGETVVLPACYDFDSGASVVPPDTACDFSLLPGPDSGTIEIYPQGGAQLAYGGVFPETPTLAQCSASAAFSGEREIVAPMAAMYVCYRTNEGRNGYLHFTGADLEQAGALTLDWVTFAVEDDDDTAAGEDLTYQSTPSR